MPVIGEVGGVRYDLTRFVQGAAHFEFMPRLVEEAWPCSVRCPIHSTELSIPDLLRDAPNIWSHWPMTILNTIVGRLDRVSIYNCLCNDFQVARQMAAQAVRWSQVSGEPLSPEATGKKRCRCHGCGRY
jgi:hypothetical protein